MLKLTIPEKELWDEEHECFVNLKEQTIRFEHSLLTISKWESKWHKPFLSKEEKTNEETLDYIKCMVLDDIDTSFVDYISKESIKEISSYIEDSMTASWISSKKQPSASRKVVTSELIYYWMVAYSIPFDCEKWHLNRLLMLIQICNEENQSQEKNNINRSDEIARRQRLNAERRAKYKTKG